MLSRLSSRRGVPALCESLASSGDCATAARRCGLAFGVSAAHRHIYATGIRRRRLLRHIASDAPNISDCRSEEGPQSDTAVPGYPTYEPCLRESDRRRRWEVQQRRPGLAKSGVKIGSPNANAPAAVEMAPTGPRAAAVPKPAVPVAEEHPPVKGPHPGYISIANQYTLEQKLRRMQKENGCDPSREDSYRLQGVQLIENVRESLQL